MPSVPQRAIAKRLNVSIATVCRSLANHPSISEETRARVLQAAQEMGYRVPRQRAKDADRPAQTFGVLVGIQKNSLGMETAPYLLNGIRKRALAEGCGTDVCYIDPGELPGGGGGLEPKPFTEANWSAAILIYPFAPATVASIAARMPVVSVLEDYGALRIDTIDTDHYTGIARLVHELVQAGHSRVGFVTWRYHVDCQWSAQRFAAYVRALFDHGLEFRPEWALNVRRQQEPIGPFRVADAVAETIRRDGVTAWVCAADHQGYQLITDLKARGVSVPDDCSVTGFDGVEPFGQAKRLASMRVPNEDIGAAAVTRLLSRLRHPAVPPRKVLVEAELVLGETIGAPPPRTMAS